MSTSSCLPHPLLCHSHHPLHQALWRRGPQRTSGPQRISHMYIHVQLARAARPNGRLRTRVRALSTHHRVGRRGRLPLQLLHLLTPGLFATMYLLMLAIDVRRAHTRNKTRTQVSRVDPNCASEITSLIRDSLLRNFATLLLVRLRLHDSAWRRHAIDRFASRVYSFLKFVGGENKNEPDYRLDG